MALALLASGCYSVGFQPVAGLTEIAVPVFDNATLRREAEHDLTRHVRREVLEATPLHLASEADGGAVLRGSVVSISEQVIVTDAVQQVLAASVHVSATFGVYAGGKLLVGEDTNGDGTPDRAIRVKGYSEYDTTRGQSRDLATQEALRDAAEQIVFRLEAREDDRMEPNDDVGEAVVLRPGRQVALRQRNQDWFRVALAPRQALRVTLYYSTGGLVLRATDDAGEPLADAEQRDEGRVLTVLGGAAERTVFLHVDGDGSGAKYQLLVETTLDDSAEPDSSPEDAKDLPGGRLAWRLRRLQRDDDYVAVSVPVGHELRAALETADKGLRLDATDGLGALHPGARTSEDGQEVVLAPQRTSERVLLRVTGDGIGRDYVLAVTLTPK